MVRTADTRRKRPTDRNPLYVVTGAGDLAVEKLREMPVKLAAELRSEPKAVAKRLGELPRDVKALPERAQAFSRATFDKAGDSYDELANRGKRVVGRVRRQKATEELAEQAGRTGRKAQATRTAARKGAAGATRSGKATVTEAKKTARAATEAAKASTEKRGD
jgi:heparin binding hemagglutinin HbhA